MLCTAFLRQAHHAHMRCRLPTLAHVSDGAWHSKDCGSGPERGAGQEGSLHEDQCSA